MTMSDVGSARPRVVVLDYGAGNVHSACKALEAAGASVELTVDRHRALEAHGLVVPGVGSFGRVMELLREVRADELIDRRLAGGRDVLGICVGLQVMFDDGVEGAELVECDCADGSKELEAEEVLTEGLGQWPGTVRRLHADVLPHMGWNTVEVPEGSALFEGVERERFYFVHSYAAPELKLTPHPAARPLYVTHSTYGERFVAAVENGPLKATQFHPEKSGAAGLALLGNWINALR